MICTFFGHRDTPAWVEAHLEREVTVLIENQKVDTFYVGDQGGFDKMAQRVIRQAMEKYDFVRGYIVLPRIPDHALPDGWKSFVPDGLEHSPPRFAVSHRNRWMVEHADIVIAYVVRSFGGAAQFVSLAQKKNKSIIFL